MKKIIFIKNIKNKANLYFIIPEDHNHKNIIEIGIATMNDFGTWDDLNEWASGVHKIMNSVHILCDQDMEK